MNRSTQTCREPFTQRELQGLHCPIRVVHVPVTLGFAWGVVEKHVPPPGWPRLQRLPTRDECQCHPPCSGIRESVYSLGLKFWKLSVVAGFFSDLKRPGLFQPRLCLNSGSWNELRCHLGELTLVIKKRLGHHCSLPPSSLCYSWRKKKRKMASMWGEILVKGSFPLPGFQETSHSKLHN